MHSDCDGEWTAQELADIAPYLHAVLGDVTRRRQRSRDAIIARAAVDEKAALEQFKAMLCGGAVAMYPPTYPAPPVEHEHSEGEEEAGPALLALPPDIHFRSLRDYDAIVKQLAEDLADGANKKAKAVFC